MIMRGEVHLMEPSAIQGTPDIIFPHLGIIIKQLDRVAFTVFGLPVYWYGVFMGLAILAGLMVAAREAKRVGLGAEVFYDFIFVAIIACVIGSRIYYVVFSWDTYKDDLISIFNLRKGGLAIYGTFIAGLITAYVFTRVKKIEFWRFGDCAVMGLILGQIIGRLGNFVNREAFGGYTDSLFAMQYLREKVEHAHIPQDILSHITMINGAEYIQVHPTFLYELLWNLCIFILMNLYKKHKKFDGEIAAMYFLGYGIGRLWIEGLRTDQLILFGTGIAVSQIVSVALVIGGVVLFIYKRRNLSKPDTDVIVK